MRKKFRNAAAKNISIDAAVAAALSEMGDTVGLKEEQRTPPGGFHRDSVSSHTNRKLRAVAMWKNSIKKSDVSS